jgi:aminoglycoside phosphotransferase (APT) family kinase protein
VPIPDQRDKAEARAALAAWFPTKIPGATGVTVSEVTGPEFTGFSSETLLFDVDWTEDGTRHHEGFVARVEPTGHLLFPDAMFDPQWRVMKALSEQTDVPLPTMWWLEDDASVLGSPFLVMGRVDGEAPPDNPPYSFEGWLLDGTPEQQARVWWSGLEAMARVHSTDWRTLGIDATGPDSRYLVGLDAQLTYYEKFLDGIAGDTPQPVLRAAEKWLRDNQPADVTPELCWGDSRLGNILFVDFEAQAVLDWEMVALGDPQQDLAWWIYFDRHHCENLGMPRIPGFAPYEDTVAWWEQRTGRNADQLDYYTVFAGYRFGVVMVRLAQMMKGFDILPMDSDYERDNTATQFLVKLLNLPQAG